ncbi:MAG TPA: alpha-ketoglutarate-dependent dioxygenase AlkB [Gemmatimonadaceae bacterium]|nr:alpha-ketoglutarate-dependent dioxygenase AlkB [Gemmatimonadaceae bacterium]
MTQFDLFGASETAAARVLPEGFRYQAEFITSKEEVALQREIRDLPFKPFEFHGYTGKRRTVSFGWHYDFATEQLRLATVIPPFLDALRAPVANFGDVTAESLTQVLVTEYEPGAGIGWHRDKAVFDRIIGISLGTPCTFRLRRPTPTGWQRISVETEPRSIYLLSGIARSEWEHSIPPVHGARHSITFRNLLPR